MFHTISDIGESDIFPSRSKRNVTGLLAQDPFNGNVDHIHMILILFPSEQVQGDVSRNPVEF